MIQTSYYANPALKNLNGEIRLIGISRGVPRWFKGEKFMPLAPTWAMVKMQDMAEYTRLYKNNILAPLDPFEIYKKLDNSILLCWEKPGEFCHRRLVAEWLENATGELVAEFGF